MSRKKHAEATEMETTAPANDQVVEQAQHQEPVSQPPAEQPHAQHHALHAQHDREPGEDASEAPRKKFTRLADPFGFENIRANENRVRLLKSEGEGAWVIRFAHNPNLDQGSNGEVYSKVNPHPVLKMLKDEGYRWKFDGGDGKGGWGKHFSGDAYGQDHIEARRVLKQAAEMLGAKVEAERTPF